ncbi:hypothetical protein N657DRAFT_605333 [Parathielavia appendiculata]|uniref:Uncharacterized protein n=1 Tax=Parathielavia appendiculata TaxID=2587402 RepID=A0AAN6YZZ4_9PEZI|nr:hypothetical protein N657DRAFT_605333 [Parathielavia appendiculata]
MSDTEDVSYSREATIAAITDYYTFLTRMYMNEHQIIYPPADGWPSIVNADPNKLQDLGKSDEVLSLLAHLPYIRCPGNWSHDADAIPGSSFADWPDLITLLVQGKITGEELRSCTEGVSFAHVSPPHVVGLVMGTHEDSPAILLDIELGIVQWENYTCPDDIGEKWSQVDWEELKKDLLDVDYLDDEVPQEEARWRYSAAAWAIPDFFEVLKDEFRSLNWIPISPHTVARSKEELHNEVGMRSMVKEIYRQHGWPDLAAYRKTECLQAVRKALAENFPDSVCTRG